MVEENEGEDKEASNSSMISKAMKGISKINLYYYVELFEWFQKSKYQVSFDLFYVYEPISGMNKGGLFIVHWFLAMIPAYMDTCPFCAYISYELSMMFQGKTP